MVYFGMVDNDRTFPKFPNYVGANDIRIDLSTLDPAFLQIARRLTPPSWQDELTRRFGIKELPKSNFRLRTGELITSGDQSILGFSPPGMEGICGISVSPGDDSQIAVARSKIVNAVGEDTHEAYVPEGQYQILLCAPQPWIDGNDIVYYTAQALVNAEVGNDQIFGRMTAFTSKQDPLSYMVLNEWRQPRILKYAFRVIPGIEFPPEPGKDMATVLRLHSLNEERQNELPGDVISGSGLIAVQFSENRLDVSGNRAIKRRRAQKDTTQQLIPAFEPVVTYAKGLTVFTRDTADAYAIERDSGISTLIGPTILLQTSSRPEDANDLISYDGVKLVVHRKPNQKLPLLQSLSSWGFARAKALISEE